MLHSLLSFRNLILGDQGVELFQGSAKIPYKQNLPVRFPPEGAVLPQHLRVVGKLHPPAQLLPQQITSALLDQDVFRIVVAHVLYLYSNQSSKKTIEFSYFLSVVVFADQSIKGI